MFIYTLILLVFLPNGEVEATQQHVDSKQECVQIGGTLIRAYAKEFGGGTAYVQCVEGHEA